MLVEQNNERPIKSSSKGADVTTMDEDGDTVVSFGGSDGDDDGDAEGRLGRSEQDENLAKYLDANARRAIGQKLKDYVEVDERSRVDHLRRLSKGLEIIGLKDIPETEAVFDGASMVNHPALAEAMVQFQSRAINEIFPPTGPVKVQVEEGAGDDEEKRADRIESYMNRQLTRDDKEYFWGVDKMLFYLPFAGSAFKKCYYDMQKRMPVGRFINVNDFIVPYDAEGLPGASRYTHRYYMTANDLKRAIADDEFIKPVNMWKQPYVANVGSENPRELSDLADKRTAVRHDDDNVYELCEMHIDFNFLKESHPIASDDVIVPWLKVDSGFVDEVGIENNKFAYPYIITFDRESCEILSIKRNWKKNDPQRRKRIWFVHYKYLPGFGFYGFGILHLIGSLGAAASGALRILLDGSLSSSVSGGFRTKEARMAGEVRFKPGEWVDVDLAAEELAKGFYSPPFKEPTPALFQTLELLIKGIERFSSTTEAMVGDSPNTGPVGTTLAIIEQGSKVFSAIHKRLHVSCKDEFEILYTLNAEYMGDAPYPMDTEKFQDESGQQLLIGSDFNSSGKHEVRPVSDPNIWSHTMRIAMAQGMLSLIASDPSLYSEKAKRRAHRAMIKALRFNDVDDYMSESADVPMDPVSENQAIIANTPVRAYQDQNHQAHIAIHKQFMQSAMAALDPALQQNFQMVMAAHIAEHIGMQYRTEIEQQLGIPLPPFDPKDPEKNKLPTDVQALIAGAVAAKINPAQPGQPPGGQPPPNPEQIKAQAKAAEDAATTQRKNVAAAADEHRKDVQAHAKEKRLDAELRARLMREGLISHPSQVSLPSDQDMSPNPQGPPPSGPAFGASQPQPGPAMQ